MSRYAKNLLLGYTCKGCKYIRIENNLIGMLGCFWHPFRDIKPDSIICRFYKFSFKSFSKFGGWI